MKDTGKPCLFCFGQSNVFMGKRSAGVVSAATERFCEAKTRAGPASVAGHVAKTRACSRSDGMVFCAAK